MTDTTSDNTLATARQISLTSSTQSWYDKLNWGMTTFYADDVVDVYRFTLNATSNFRLSLSGFSNNLDVALYNSSSSMIQSSKQGGTTTDSISYDNLGAGTYYAAVAVVSGNSTTYPYGMETNYNLSMSATPLVTAQPADLTSSVRLTSYSFNKGDTIYFVCSVRNGGATAASASSLGIYVDDSLVTTVAFGAIDPNTQLNQNANIATTNFGDGTHRLYVKADDGNAVTESNEYNNASNLNGSEIFTVTSPTPVTPPDDGGTNPVTPPDDGGTNPVTPPDDGGTNPVTPPDDGGTNPVTPPDDGGTNPVTTPDDGGTNPVTTPDDGGTNPVTPPDDGGTNPVTPHDDGNTNPTNPDTSLNVFTYNGHSYLLSNAGTWQEAQTQAQSLGGNLVTVNDQAEQDWLVSTFSDKQNLWIGLTDQETEGSFKWISGENSTYTHWKDDQPDNHLYTVDGEDYAHFWQGLNGQWNDARSFEGLMLQGIIEINPTAKSSLTGTAEADVIEGRVGNDTLDGGLGADVMIGKTGNDSYYVDNVGDVVTETSTLANEIDAVYSSVSYRLSNHVENLTLTGTAKINATGNHQNNILIGNAAKNTLNGDAGADIMDGKDGNDTYIVDNVRDLVTEQYSDAKAGIDTVQSFVNYSLGDNIENLTLLGKKAISAVGNNLNNLLIGSAADNKLNGDAGNDILIGGLGKDVLTGGTGADKFKWNAVADSGLKATNRDIITDFHSKQKDKIDLSAIDANTVTANNNAFSNLTVGNAFSGSLAHQGDLFFDKTAHILYGNNDTDKLADFAIQLSGVTTLSKADFVL